MADKVPSQSETETEAVMVNMRKFYQFYQAKIYNARVFELFRSFS